MHSSTTGLDPREIRHFHLFAGLGGGTRGFNGGIARVGNMQAVFRCIGGVDVSPAAIRDFGRLAGIPGTLLDLDSRAPAVHRVRDADAERMAEAVMSSSDRVVSVDPL